MNEFEQQVLRFMARFNEGDLDATVADFTEDGRYIDEFGQEHAGRGSIRAALTPIFDGSYGKLAYTVESSILDPDKGRALVTWTLRIAGPEGSASRMYGLDLLEFDSGKVCSKNCYIKAKELLIEAGS